MATTGEQVRMNTADVDRQLGAWLGGGQLLDPLSATDIRRWVQGMQYPNTIHYDAQAAASGSASRVPPPVGIWPREQGGPGSSSRQPRPRRRRRTGWRRSSANASTGAEPSVERPHEMPKKSPVVPPCRPGRSGVAPAIR